MTIVTKLPIINMTTYLKCKQFQRFEPQDNKLCLKQFIKFPECQDDDCDEAAERGGEEEGGRGERGASCPGHHCHHHIDVKVILLTIIIIK